MNIMVSGWPEPLRPRHCFISIVVLILLPVVGNANGQIHVDADAPGGGDGSSWALAFQDLQMALDAAAGGGGDEVRIAAGTYVPSVLSSPPDGRSATFQLVDGVMLAGGYAGFGEPDPDLRDPALFETRLSGDLAGNDIPPFGNNGENAYHVLICGNTITSATILD
ncbi:MAG: hypothetical protein O7F76_01045 [Planctomycetota bacterium]|nr:hypothetical protein [Planctomycetota bacterium]